MLHALIIPEATQASLAEYLAYQELERRWQTDSPYRQSTRSEELLSIWAPAPNRPSCTSGALGLGTKENAAVLDWEATGDLTFVSVKLQ